MSATLPPTATGSDFNAVFAEVTHCAVTAAKRAQVRLFHLNVNSAQFSLGLGWCCWACAQVVDGLFMRLLSRPLGVVRIRWGICR